MAEAEQAAMTAAEELFQEGFKQGHEEGSEEGRVKGLRSAVQHLLLLKFGLRREESQERLEAATEEDLRRYLERVLIAPTVDGVFAPE